MLDDDKEPNTFKRSLGKLNYLIYAIIIKGISFSAVCFHYLDLEVFPLEIQASTSFFVWFGESLYNQLCLAILTLNNILKERSLRKISTILENLQTKIHVDCIGLHRVSVRATAAMCMLYFVVYLPLVFVTAGTINTVSFLVMVLYMIDGLGFVLYQVYVLVLICLLEKLLIAVNLRLRFALKPQVLVSLLQQHSRILKCTQLINQCFGVFMLVMMFELLFTLTNHLYFHVFVIWPVERTFQSCLLVSLAFIWIGPQLVLWLAVVVKCNSFAHKVSRERANVV